MTESKLSFTPVIIIGAGRSGTNILRDSLTNLSEFTTWNCDEINPIWRHGNLQWPNDEIPLDRATGRTRAFIRSAFKRQWLRGGSPAFVVEKTCANSLRVPFVNAILPEAKFVHIVRNGEDVVRSAQKRWRGELEVPGFQYFASKIRYTPLIDLPLYGMAFLRSRVGMLTGRTKRLSVWGPRFKDLPNMQSAPLDEICATQWANCVSLADHGFSDMDPSRILTVHYEAFVKDPVLELQNILDFLGASYEVPLIEEAVATVRRSSGKSPNSGANEFGVNALSALRPVMIKYGYEV